MTRCPVCGQSYPAGERFCDIDGAALIEEPPPVATKSGEMALPPSDRSGAMIGTHRLVKKLGEGGMGEVYEAVHPILGRRIAIKLIDPAQAKDPKKVARFFDEARSLSR